MVEGVVHAHDSGVIQPCKQPGLALQAAVLARGRLVGIGDALESNQATNGALPGQLHPQQNLDRIWKRVLKCFWTTPAKRAHAC